MCVSSLRSLVPLALRPQVSAGTDAPPAPQPPLDFQTIDTPQKAALTPSVMAVSQLWAADLMVEGLPTEGRLSSENLKMAVGDQRFGINYVINSDHPNHMDAQGTLGNAVVTEQWDRDKDGSIHITGRVGSSAESLTIGVDKAGNWNQFDGTIGNQEVHLTLAPDHDSLVWDGSIGGQSTHEKLERQQDDTLWHFSGTLGTDAASVGTNMDIHKVVAGNEKILTGSGTVAGVPVDYSQDIAYGSTPA